MEVSCKEGEILALRFTPFAQEDNIVIIKPEMPMNTPTGYSICLRINFMAWNMAILFSSTYFELQGYSFDQSFYRNGKFWHGYKWPNDIQISYSSWFPICVVYEASEMLLNVTIGQELVLSLAESGVQNKLRNLSNDDIKLGGSSTFFGHITDFNVWSRPLSTEEVEKYHIDCREDMSRTLKPDIISWSNLDLANQTGKNKIIYLQTNLLCENQLKNQSDLLFISPFGATYDVAENECKNMNVEMSPLETETDRSNILFLGRGIKLEPKCADKIWLPITELATNFSIERIDAQNLTFQSIKGRKVCKRLDLISNHSKTIDCDGLSCFSCQFPQKRLIFTLKGLCPELHDTQYFLSQENVQFNKIVLTGVSGLTNIVHESFPAEWKIISLQDNTVIGMRNDTGFFLPLGLKTWYLDDCAKQVKKLPVKLKLSNVSLFYEPFKL